MVLWAPSATIATLYVTSVSVLVLVLSYLKPTSSIRLSTLRFKVCEPRLLAACLTHFTLCTRCVKFVLYYFAKCLDTSTHLHTPHVHSCCKSGRDRGNVNLRCCTALSQSVKYLLLLASFSSLWYHHSTFISKSNVSPSSHIIVYSVL